MKSLTIALLALVIMCAPIRAQDYGAFDGNAREVSLVQLIAQPEKYLDSVVRVRGALHWEFEGYYLFLTRDHLETWDTASAVWLVLSKKSGAPTGKQMEECSDALVMLEGIFHRDTHSQICSVEVSRVQVRDGHRSKDRQKESNQSSQPPRPSGG